MYNYAMVNKSSEYLGKSLPYTSLKLARENYMYLNREDYVSYENSGIVNYKYNRYYDVFKGSENDVESLARRIAAYNGNLLISNVPLHALK